MHNAQLTLCSILRYIWQYEKYRDRLGLISMNEHTLIVTSQVFQFNKDKKFKFPNFGVNKNFFFT
jgi:hypothetical protein